MQTGIINDTSENFDYWFFGNYDRNLTSRFKETQESDLRKILKFLNINDLDRKYLYKVFPTLTEKQIADPNHSVSRASTRVEEGAVYRVLGPEMDMLGFPHEIVHLVAHEISPHYNWEVVLDTFDGQEQKKTMEFSSISFLQEGLALVIDEVVFNNKLTEAGESRLLDEWIKYNQGKHDVKPSGLIGFYSFCQQPALIATPICGSFCKYLVDSYGLDKFMEIYKNTSELNPELKNIEIIENTYSKKIADLESEWSVSIL